MMYVGAFDRAAWVYGCEARVHIGGRFNEWDAALEGSGARTLRSNTRILKSHIPMIGIICCVLSIVPCMHMGIHARVSSVVLLDRCHQCTCEYNSRATPCSQARVFALFNQSS